jgi:hypothetical protein
MSDFDKFFKERLEGEAEFPNGKKNWKQVSKRLDAFQTGQLYPQPSKALVYWKAAAVAASVGLAVLGYCYVDLKKENATLADKAAQVIAIQTPAIVPNDASGTSTDNIQISNADSQPISGSKMVPTLPTFSGSTNKSVTGNRLEAPAKLRNEVSKKNSRPTSEPQTSATVESSTAAVQNVISVQPNDEAKKNPSQEITSVREDKTETPILENNALSAVVSQEVPLPLQELVSEPSPVQTEQRFDIPAFEVRKITPPSHITKPYRPKQGMYVGIEGFAGRPQPAQSGVSTLLGQGISIKKGVWRGFSLTADAQWLRYEEKSTDLVPRLHPKRGPHHGIDTTHHGGPGGGPGGPSGPGGQPKYNLVGLESSPRQTRVNVGLAYTLPLPTRIRPSAMLTYGWIYRPSTNVILTWEEKEDPNGPHGGGDPRRDQGIKKTDADWLRGNWRLSIGAAYTRRRWTTGLWADYSKQLATNEPLFDSIFLRAGLQYRLN